jgi:hypothetical protein
MERPTISALELPPVQPGSPLATEWETYRTQIRAWLEGGREGQFVLIKGNEVVGFWDLRDDAMLDGYRRFWGHSFLVKQILSREPLFRIGIGAQLKCRA